MTPASAAPSAVDLLVDWELAARTAALVGRPGPQVSVGQAVDVVAELRDCAAAAVPHVAEVTGLVSTGEPAVLVVDRPGWSRANVGAFRRLLEPVVSDVFARRGRTPAAPLTAVGSRVTAAEVGSLLGFFSSRVLGQYDAFHDPAPQPDAGPATPAGLPRRGRLLLVAPNVVHTERELGVDARDFRLWVCLHEETHRTQFTATPWLADHLVEQVRSLVRDLIVEPSQVAQRLVSSLRGLPEVLRGEGSGAPLLDLVQTPEQRERLAAMTAVMSLLEGHADVVMDDVGPAVVPSVAVIRERFSRRRAGRGAVDQVLRRLMGLDAKVRQYADGARFVRAVVGKVGMDGFNAVWSEPQALPHPAEIADPAAWVARVHG
jgi:coenzyme F420 biosynthesis associated uncharacterized protein